MIKPAARADYLLTGINKVHNDGVLVTLERMWYADKRSLDLHLINKDGTAVYTVSKTK